MGRLFATEQRQRGGIARRDRDACGIPPRGIRRFGRNENGATAVEFAVIALPFFALLYGILQVSLLYMAQEVLETGVYEAARLVRTGQVQAGGMDEDDIRKAICGNTSGLVPDCEDDLVLDVRSFRTFQAVSLPPPLDSKGELNESTSFSPGAGGEVVIFRAFYAYSLPIPDGVTGLANMSDGRRLLAASASFRNEPF